MSQAATARKERTRKDTTMIIRVTSKDKRAFVRVAKRRGLSLSGLIREILEDARKRGENGTANFS